MAAETMAHAVLDKLQDTLKPEIDKGLVSVLGTAATPIVRIPGRDLFPTNGASVQTAFVPVLERIGPLGTERDELWQRLLSRSHSPSQTMIRC